MTGNTEAASEKKKRGRPRAAYSSIVLKNGETLETPAGEARTRRGQQNEQLAFRAWTTLLHNWRPEFAWYWYAEAGAVDPSFASSGERDIMRWAHTGTWPRGCRRARSGVLAELGRINDKALRIAWAAALCTLPLATNTRAVERFLRRQRLGRDDEPRLRVEASPEHLVRVADGNEEAEEELPLAEAGGVLLRARVSS